jgi:DNA-binding CsgD family transcriptional regulator/PAS domain-containing protein
MAAANRLLELIQQLYTAPGTIEGWPAFLETLRVTVHGSGANLICHSLQSQKGTMLATVGYDADGIRLYQQHWSARDPWAHSPKQSLVVEGSVSVGDELIEHAAFKRTAFYADFARHYDLVRMIGGVLEKGSVRSSVLSVSRNEQQQPFGEDELVLFEALVPHLQRALQFHRRLIGAGGAAEDFANVINNSSRAVLLFNSEGRVIFANRAASRLMAMRDGLSIERGELRAAQAADTTHLRALVADAVRTSNGEGLGAGGVLAIGRPSGRQRFLALVCPVSRHRTFFPGMETTAATVFVTDPEQSAVADEDTLRACFGLTAAEAKLTRLLAQGCALTEASAQLGLRRETTRSRVKTIFEKTNTHRQSELVRLVLNGTPRI